MLLATVGSGCGKKFEERNEEEGPVIYACIDGDPDCGTSGTGGNAGSADNGGNAGSDTSGTGGDTGTGGSAGTGTGGDTGTSGSAGSAGTAGTTADAGAGGNAGSGTGTGGSAGAGDGGETGTGGDTCTGIYLQLASVSTLSSLPNTSGAVTYATYDVYGTSPGNELNATVTLVNNVSGDFTDPVATTALEAVYLRCADPNGGNIWSEACNQSIASGSADCAAPGCYSASNGVVQMQIQIDPALTQTGQIRIGIDPDSVSICGDQSQLPIVFISN